MLHLPVHPLYCQPGAEDLQISRRLTRHLYTGHSNKPWSELIKGWQELFQQIVQAINSQLQIVLYIILCQICRYWSSYQLVLRSNHLWNQVNHQRAETELSQFQLGQYHGCWCPGSLRRQDISSHDIDYVEYVGPCLTWIRISSTWVISMLRNDIKCKYLFMSALNLARKGLTLMGGPY